MSEATRFEALHHLVQVSAEVEAQLHLDKGHLPIKAILARAREEAAEAIVRLTQIDPTVAHEIRRLQTVARRYESLTQWLREIVREGAEAAEEIDEAKSEHMRGLILDMDDETASALGIRQPGAPTE